MAKKLELNDFKFLLSGIRVTKDALPVLAGALIAKTGCTYPHAMRFLSIQARSRNLSVSVFDKNDTEEYKIRGARNDALLQVERIMSKTID